MFQEKSNDFFQLRENDGVCEITIRNEFLNFEQLSHAKILRDKADNRIFRITGKSSTEAYFCLGFWLTYWKASSIICIGAKSGEEMLHFDYCREHSAVSKKWLQCYLNPQGGIMAEIRAANTQNGQWSVKDLELEVPSELPASSSGKLSITGRGSVWMYMQLGISAALAGFKDIYISKPVLPYEIHITSDGVCEACSIKRNSKHGSVIGILGDPNSGKSVFSRNFAMTIRNTMPHWFESWIYDCDLASPTPEWYLNDCEGTREQRQAIKRHWTPELEKRVVNDLQILRNNLDLTLADMPGGKKTGNELNRIPTESRAEMMKQCDAFIILCRQDQEDEIFNAWHRALAEYHLENRIIARIVSDNPDDEFSISPFQINDEGLFSARITGLDRKKDRTEIIRIMRNGLYPLIKYLSYIRVARDAQAACTQAFLTGNHGTRYGAAVRSSLTGKIFTAGQYSSFNHSTNMHAEMNALSFAANSGEPDVDVLAVACSDHTKAIPCGVCRQVMKEHAQRTSRDFDVVMVKSGIHFEVAKVSELLPKSWQTKEDVSVERDCRNLTITPDLFASNCCQIGATCWEKDELLGSTLSLIWDPCFTPNEILKKIKYVQVDGFWQKLPHAFTDSHEYQKILTDHRYNSSHFPQIALVNHSALKGFCNPRPLAEETDFSEEHFKRLADLLFIPAEIDPYQNVLIFGSRLLKRHCTDSDYDLIVRGKFTQIRKLRSLISANLRNGIFTLPKKSNIIRYLNDILPGSENILESGRYCETLQYQNIQISFMFIPSQNDGPAFDAEPVSLGKRRFCGTIISDDYAPFKRSETVLKTEDGVNIRLLCYHKVGNMLRNGDRIAVCGTYFESNTGTSSATLLMVNASVDNIVWMT